MNLGARLDGSSAARISIADWPVLLNLDDCDQEIVEKIRHRYEAFLAPGPLSGGEALNLAVRAEAGPPFIPLEQSGIWQIRSSSRDGRMFMESHFEVGWVDWAANRGSATIRPESDLENFLRVLYAWQCVRDGALLLHACGVIRGGRGYVFFGPSGTGKTTIARLSLGHTILSDDLVILKKCGERFFVYGVPFRGDYPEAPRTNAAAELSGLYMPIKDLEHRVGTVDAAEAVARLAACAPFVMGDPTNASAVVRICAELQASMPARALHFRRDADFWEAIDGAE